MNTSQPVFCCGCRSSDRKMSLLQDDLKKHCFLQIIQELSISQPHDFQVWLCWECKATVRRFVKFKGQVQKLYKILQNYSTQEHHLFQPSHLHTQNVLSLSLVPDITEIDDKHEFKYEIVKLENENNFCMKEEPLPDNVSICSEHSDDDKFLIEISTMKKSQKPLNGVRKKRKRRELKSAGTEMGSNIYKEIELKGVEIEEERRLMMEREEYTNAMFRCEKCIVTFPNMDDLKDHENNKHVLNASNYKCSICECSFATEVSYNYHTSKHARRYQCVVCTERFSSKRAATKHYETVHCFGMDVEYKLNTKPLDGGESELADKLDDDPKSPAASFPCEFCQKTFRWKTSLRKHVETHRIETGQKRKPYCEPCRLSFTTTSNLQKHVKTSSKHQIQLKLRKLKPSVTDDSAIEQIKSSVNSARQTFPCGQCDRRFQWRGNLLRHLHSHAARANGELVCEPCNRTFSSIATYKQHMKISKKHVSENDFKYMCSDCGKRFANKTRLKDHVDWEHLKNYVHTCALCQKAFRSHTSLYLHRQVVHKKDGAEHLCDHCGKAFPNHAKLRSHMTALHTAESPYACAACGARFGWHSCLSRHVRRVHRAQGKRHKAEAV